MTDAAHLESPPRMGMEFREPNEVQLAMALGQLQLGAGAADSEESWKMLENGGHF